MSFYPATLVAWATVSTSTRISALNGGNISLVVRLLVILTKDILSTSQSHPFLFPTSRSDFYTDLISS